MSGRTDVVELAIERFSAEDDQAFLEVFTDDIVIWAVPELAGGDVVFRSRSDLANWTKAARQQWTDVRFGRGDLIEHGEGVYLELDVFTESAGGGSGWRLPLAIFFRGDKVAEVAPQPDRETALRLLEAR